jgi:hypothetical protein
VIYTEPIVAIIVPNNRSIRRYTSRYDTLHPSRKSSLEKILSRLTLLALAILLRSDCQARLLSRFLAVRRDAARGRRIGRRDWCNLACARVESVLRSSGRLTCHRGLAARYKATLDPLPRHASPMRLALPCPYLTFTLPHHDLALLDWLWLASWLTFILLSGCLAGRLLGCFVACLFGRSVGRLFVGRDPCPSRQRCSCVYLVATLWNASHFTCSSLFSRPFFVLILLRFRFVASLCWLRQFAFSMRD